MSNKFKIVVLLGVAISIWAALIFVKNVYF